MLVKIIIVIALIAILIALTTGLIQLVRDKGNSTRVVKSLSIRIILSLALFAFLIFAFIMGWIQPQVPPFAR